MEEEFLRYLTAFAERVVFLLKLWCWWPPLAEHTKFMNKSLCPVLHTMTMTGVVMKW